MKVYPPNQKTLEESQEDSKNFNERAAQMDVSDQTLMEYVQVFLQQYRKTLEDHFSSLAPAIPFYAHYPFETMILRVGNNGVIIGHRSSKSATIKIMRPTDFDPPMSTVDIFDVVQRWQTPFNSFDFSIRDYSEDEARLEATRQVLSNALDYFWSTLDEQIFAELGKELLEVEEIKLDTEVRPEDKRRYDAVGQVLLMEPAEFRRFAKWAFEFKHYRDERVSANTLRQVEAYLEDADAEIDVICLLTSGDLTSIGNHIVVKNPRIRVWDRIILNRLIHQHLEVFEHHFPEYPVALKALSQQFEETTSTSTVIGRVGEFEGKLESCPTGQAHFSKYEEIGIEIWQHLFSETLGEPKPQVRTRDGKQRRDVLFQNKRVSNLFQRVAERFDADFIIVDFKNYTDPVNAEIIDDVARYANKALGRFIVVTSRHGADDTVEASQHRWFRDSDTVVLVISDAQMLEMVARKERGETPEDVLEDLLDEFLIRY